MFTHAHNKVCTHAWKIVHIYFHCSREGTSTHDLIVHYVYCDVHYRLYTMFIAMSTTDCTLCLLRCPLQIVHYVYCDVHYRLYTMFIAMSTTDCTLCLLRCPLQIVHYVYCDVHYRLYTMFIAMSTTYCTLCLLRCPLQIVHYVYCDVHYRLYTMFIAMYTTDKGMNTNLFNLIFKITKLVSIDVKQETRAHMCAHRCACTQVRMHTHTWFLIKTRHTDDISNNQSVCP